MFGAKVFYNLQYPFMSATSLLLLWFDSHAVIRLIFTYVLFFRTFLSAFLQVTLIDSLPWYYQL